MCNYTIQKSVYNKYSKVFELYYWIKNNYSSEFIKLNEVPTKYIYFVNKYFASWKSTFLLDCNIKMKNHTTLMSISFVEKLWTEFKNHAVQYFFPIHKLISYIDHMDIMSYKKWNYSYIRYDNVCFLSCTWNVKHSLLNISVVSQRNVNKRVYRFIFSESVFFCFYMQLLIWWLK